MVWRSGRRDGGAQWIAPLLGGWRRATFGAAKPLRDAPSFELRLDFGPGYRVYYGRDGKTVVVLLGGGSKRRQDADIAAAVERCEAIQTGKSKKWHSHETIKKRSWRGSNATGKFARALYAEAINAFLAGETAEGLSMLRDLVHAEITFKELARQTGLGEKTLHRMLNRRGNPTARNLGVIVKSIAEDLGIKPRVEWAVGR